MKSEEKRAFHIKSYIETIWISLIPKIKKGKHSLLIQCDDTLEVDSYPEAFSQIITHLIMNALIHAFDESTEGTITFEIEKKGDFLLIVCTDNGKGMNADELKKIFIPFYTTNRSKGSGLGLNIIYNQITQLLDGQIECESQIGVGTMFIIQFRISKK